MEVALRFYLDKIPDEVKAGVTDPILKVFELFSSVLKVSYDYIEYSLPPIDEEPYIINKKYAYDKKGKEEFLNTRIILIFRVEDGEMTPFVKAGCDMEWDQLYSRIKVEFDFGRRDWPDVLRVCYKQKDAEKLDFPKYRKIIRELCDLGFHVNNSLHDAFLTQKGTTTLENIRWGSPISFHGRRNLKRARLHTQKKRLNHLMDVYCANAVPRNLLSEDGWSRVAKIVEKENIALVGGTMVFALPELEKVTPMYRMWHRKTLLELRKIFGAE